MVYCVVFRLGLEVFDVKELLRGAPKPSLGVFGRGEGREGKTTGNPFSEHKSDMENTYPRDASTSAKGTWTPQTHSKDLLKGYLNP